LGTLRDAVEEQSKAHVRGDDGVFASYMTPQALLQIRGNGRTAPRRFEIIEVHEQTGVGRSAVRYIGSGSYVLRQAWEETGGEWRVVHAERPRDEVREPFWRRLFRRDRDDSPQRSELV
jgi:hypothetical protein